MNVMASYCLRLLGILLMTVCFFSGAALFRWIAIPTLWMFSRSQALFQQRVRWVLQNLSKLFFWMVHRFCIFKISVRGQVPNDTNVYLVVANHPSLLDSLLLLSIFPNAICIAKPALCRAPILGGILKNAGFIFATESETHALTACLNALKEGISVIIFPEGTRTDPEIAVGAFKPGAAVLMLRSHATTIPVGITCTPRIFYKRQPWREFINQRFELGATICDAASLSKWPNSLIEERHVRPLVLQQLRDTIISTVMPHHEQHDTVRTRD